MTQTLTLKRTSDDGKRTIGTMVVGNTTLFTLEEPWKDNANGISCVPPGTYPVVPHGWHGEPVKFKQAYRLTNTGPRVAILIHSGNTTDDIEGCILVGMSKGKLNGKDAVLRSRDALNLLRGFMGDKPFTLVIEGVPA